MGISSRIDLAELLPRLWWEVVNYPTSGTMRQQNAKLANRWRYWQRWVTREYFTD